MNFGRNEILIGVAVLAVAALVVVPVLVSTSRTGRVREVEETVEAIRQAEIQHHELFGAFVSAQSAPRPPYAVDPQAVPWVPSEGFRQLSFSPARAEVIGSYQVQAEGQDFKVIGTCDADGDGTQARFEATRDQAAHATTESGVY
jgi:type II secretory pathway pseudopilin PulG